MHDSTNLQRYKRSRTAKRQATQELSKVMMDGIHLATCARHWEVVKELLPFMDIHQIWKRGGSMQKSILGYACENFNLEEIRYLVEESGANVNGGEHTIAPLLSAIHNKGIVKYLLEKGAEVNNPRDPLTSPIYVACSTEEHKEAVKVMVEYGRRVDDSLLFITQEEVMARRMILMGANVNALNSSMRTPLSYAMENRKLEVYLILLFLLTSSFLLLFFVLIFLTAG